MHVIGPGMRWATPWRVTDTEVRQPGALLGRADMLVVLRLQYNTSNEISSSLLIHAEVRTVAAIARQVIRNDHNPFSLKATVDKHPTITNIKRQPRVRSQTIILMLR